MKRNIFKQLAIVILGIVLLPLEMWAATHYVTQPQYISVCGPSFVNNMDETWIIDLGVNKRLKIDCYTDLESADYLRYLTSTGVEIRDLTYGCIGGCSFYTMEQNGKAIIRFTSDGSICYPNGYWGFELYVSVDDRNYVSGVQLFMEKTYFSNPVVIGSLAGETSLQYTFNVGGSSYFNGNSYIAGSVGMGCLPTTNKQLSIRGDFLLNGLAFINRRSGQFINLTANSNNGHIWSIGTVFGTNKFVIGKGATDNVQFSNYYLTIATDGKVGIGTTNPQYLLDVKGAIRSTEVIAEAIEWFPDFVFHKDYPLPALSEVDRFIQENGHLPDIPTESEVKEKGLNITDMQVKLLQKVEELTLYIIQQEKKIELLEEKLSGMEKK